MTLAQARTALQQRGYGTDTATAQDELLKSVARRVWRMRRWDFREAKATAAATIGTPNYALTAFAADVAQPDAVRVEFGTDYEDLVFLAPQDFRDLEHVDRTNAFPEWWTLYASELRIYPRPERAYTITLDYLKTVPAFGDSVELPGPADYHDVYIEGAIAQIARRERDPESFGLANAEYATRLREMIEAHGLRQRQSSRRVVKSGFFRDEV